MSNNIETTSASSLGSLVYDEDDSLLMREVSESIASFVPEIFPSSIPISNSEQCTLHYSSVHVIPKEALVQCFRLVDTNLRTFYVKHQGLKWKSNKLEEMREDGLVYVWYVDANNDLIAFVSFILTYSSNRKVLYLYEIHVNPKYHSKKIGSVLMKNFHGFAKHLNSLTSDHDKYRHFCNDGTCLTVFSDNDKALAWYYKLAYQLTDDSPKDKVLRSKKIVKPDYYLLIRLHG